MLRFHDRRVARLVLSIGMLSLALVSGCRSPSGDEVGALRYEVWVAGDLLEAEHGFGRWSEEFFLPESGVCFSVDANYDGDMEAHALFATLGERTSPNYGEPH